MSGFKKKLVIILTLSEDCELLQNCVNKIRRIWLGECLISQLHQFFVISWSVSKQMTQDFKRACLLHSQIMKNLSNISVVWLPGTNAYLALSLKYFPNNGPGYHLEHHLHVEFSCHNKSQQCKRWSEWPDLKVCHLAGHHHTLLQASRGAQLHRAEPQPRAHQRAKECSIPQNTQAWSRLRPQMREAGGQVSPRQMTLFVKSGFSYNCCRHTHTHI